MPGVLHGCYFAKKYNCKSDKNLQIFSNQSITYKKIILFESFPRFLIPILLNEFSSNAEMLSFSILIKLLIVFSIYTVSIIPIASISKNFSIDSRSYKVVEIIGLLNFLLATVIIFVYSDEIVALLSNSNVHPKKLEWLAFITLGATSIFTQPYISKMSQGNELLMREFAAKVSLLTSLILSIPLIFYFGASGGFLLLVIFQCVYFVVSRRTIS